MSTSNTPTDKLLTDEILAKIDELFDSDGEYRQEPEEDSRRPCSKCLQPAPRLAVCARCKAVLYCSRECQKMDWPVHKLLCYRAAEADLAAVCKFVQRFLNKILRTTSNNFDYYSQSAVLQQIRSKNLEFSVEATFNAKVLLGFEPVDILDFSRIIKSPTISDSKWCPKGMLQILDIDVSIENNEEILNRPDIAKARGTLAGGFVKFPIVLLNVIYCKPDAQFNFQNYSYSTVMPLFFNNTADPSGPDTLTIPSMASDKKGVKKPKSFNSCLEFINMTIRNDHRNRYLARANMSREDMQGLQMIMNGQANRSPQSFALAKGYMRKVIREDIYGFTSRSAEFDVE